jgi:phosphoribosylglycinamide formyltransferase-1
MKKKIKLAIFASGNGSNAEKIIEYFADHQVIEVALIVSNKADAGVLNIAKRYAIAANVISVKDLNRSEVMLAKLQEKEIDFVILAGFLLKIPDFLIQKFDRRIVNIHPALLPKFGGKGMYGIHVHQAVKTANESETGMTIHFVNEHYDEGQIILQKSCAVHPNDTVEDIAKNVLQLEHTYFAPEIEKICLNFQKKPY